MKTKKKFIPATPRNGKGVKDSGRGYIPNCKEVSVPSYSGNMRGGRAKQY